MNKARSGFSAKPRLNLAEVTRLAEMAYRHAVWLDVELEETPDQFAESVLNQFEALLADHAEIAGYAFRADGWGKSVADHAYRVPGGWRPGWGWPGREMPKRLNSRSAGPTE